MVPMSDEFIVEIYLDSKDKLWRSRYRYNGKIGVLGPNQMEQFFRSDFYRKMEASLAKKWPLSDKEFGEMFDAVKKRTMNVVFSESDLADEIDERQDD